MACFVALLLVDRYQPLLLLRLRNLERHAIALHGRTTPPNPNLVFLAIDSDSFTLGATTDVKELYGLTDQNSIEARTLKLMSQAGPGRAKFTPWFCSVSSMPAHRWSRLI